jgi:hypothetical protein
MPDRVQQKIESLTSLQATALVTSFLSLVCNMTGGDVESIRTNLRAVVENDQVWEYMAAGLAHGKMAANQMGQAGKRPEN